MNTVILIVIPTLFLFTILMVVIKIKITTCKSALQDLYYCNTITIISIMSFRNSFGFEETSIECARILKEMLEKHSYFNNEIARCEQKINRLNKILNFFPRNLKRFFFTFHHPNPPHFSLRQSQFCLGGF